MEQQNQRFLDLLREHIPAPSKPQLERQIEANGGTLALLQAVVAERLFTKDHACLLWGSSLDVAYIDPLATLVSSEALALIPAEIAKKANVLPLYLIGETLTIATATPKDADLLRRLTGISQHEISPVFSIPSEIEGAISIYYCNEATIEESLNTLSKNMVGLHANLTPEQINKLTQDTSFIEVVDSLIHFAMRERSTDIHIEAQETLTRIRFRIDGTLREVLTIAKQLHAPLISRLKIISGLNISENRTPQDGRFTLPIGPTKGNFRISTIPSQFGEKAVIRILALTGKRELLTLEKALVSQSILAPLRRLIKNPNGILFVTGPTGSGKTTTLYSVLHEINDSGLNISTIEDPIEIQLAGVNQSQVNPGINVTFSSMLRALLRQDPDVILLGEIRDLETAKIATETALTGHLVLATLHTNSAPQAITRLLEIGVEPYMVAPCVIGVLAQRLVARICENCKEAYQPSREQLLKYFQPEGLVDVPFYRGKGCANCRGTGYRGRIAFHELVLVTEEIRALIADRRSVQEITVAAAKVGYKPLRYDALKKVLLGLTTIEQVEEHCALELAV